MKASIYFALICLESRVCDIPADITAFLSEERKRIKNGNVFFRSPEQEFGFYDLGASLFEYLKNTQVPNFLGLGEGCTAYIQIVPKTGEEQLRVYLEAALVTFLANHGLGLDIHAQ